MITDKTPIKTVHVGAAGYADYTVVSQDEDKQLDISTDMKKKRYRLKERETDIDRE